MVVVTVVDTVVMNVALVVANMVLVFYCELMITIVVVGEFARQWVRPHLPYFPMEKNMIFSAYADTSNLELQKHGGECIGGFGVFSGTTDKLVALREGEGFQSSSAFN